MVQSSRPQSRSGRNTRSNPLPDAAESGASSTKKTANNHAHPPPKTRNRHPPQSNTLLCHGFSRTNGSINPTEPSSTSSHLAGHKRTRSAASAQDQPPSPVISPERAAQPQDRSHRQHDWTTTIKDASPHIAFADEVKVLPAAVNGHSNTTAPHPPHKPPADKRTLRSQDGTSRLNSDLAIYFANFDDVMNDVPVDIDLFTVGTKIVLIDEPIKAGKAQAGLPLRGKHDSNSSPSRTSASKSPRRGSHSNGLSLSATQSTSQSKHNFMNGAQPLNLTSISSSYTVTHTQPKTDPLADSHYFVAHRRGERKEKQLRNVEREHAQHEKVQLEGLLDGLRGPDWLRVMGITGITEGESKDWKPKRNYFIKEVKVLLDKFAMWREEEKRMKAEKDAKLIAELEDEEDETVNDVVAEGEEEEEEEEEGEEDEEDESVGANSSDIDASAAQQLLEEASIARKRPQGKRRVKLSQKIMEVNTKHPPPPPPPPGPFVSFYPAPHLRAQALGKQRHGGRKETAFGKTVPDVADADFVLPKELTSPDALRDHARKRRRLKRDGDGDKAEQAQAGSSTTGRTARDRRR